MHALLIALAACCLGQTASKAYTYRGARMAATVHVWTNGAANGEWDDVANWDTGAIPGAGGAGFDTAMFDGDRTQIGPSVNLDRVGAFDVPLFRIITKANFTGDIGGSGNPLIHEIDTSGTNYKARVIHAGSGTVYFTAEGNTDYAHVGPGKSYLDCTATPGDLRNVFVTAGYVNLAATAAISAKLIIDGAGAEVVATAESGAGDAPGLTVITAGTYANGKTMAASDYLIVFGGTVTQTGRIADGANVIIGPAGRVNYKPASALGAAYNPRLVCAGAFDVSDSNYDVECEQFILLQLANTLGAPLQQGDFSPIGIDIDLREEYP